MKSLKSFRSFNEERSNSIVITFGRFQPPTIGHEKLFKKVVSLADANKYRIYTSQTVDAKNNPLSYSNKIKFLRKMFPKYGRNIIEDTKIKTIFDALTDLHSQKFDKIILVVGSDRVNEFKKVLLKYNGVEARHGFYDFKNGIEIFSSGERDPDSDGVSGMSASKMRAAAKENNFELFKKGLPKNFKEALDLFDAVRADMGLKESKRIHIQIDPISPQREDYINGSLFAVNDIVRIIESGEEAKITELGPNFLVLENKEGASLRKWLTAVEKIDK